MAAVAPSSKRRKTSKQYCPHCDKEVSKSTWYRHYSDFYNQLTNTWEKRNEPDFCFSSSSNESEDEANADYQPTDNFDYEEQRFDEQEYEEMVEGYSITNIGAEKEQDRDAELWDSSDESADESPDTSVKESNNILQSKIISFMCIFLLTWKSVFRVANASMGILFKFISLLLLKLSELTSSPGLRYLHQLFPDTLLKAEKFQSINRDNFRKLIVCPKCHSTFESTDLTETSEVPKCSYVRFPRHPQRHMRKQCGEPLMKTVKTASGKKKLVPLKTFCYRSIIDSIRNFMEQPGMVDIFNQWRTREIPNGVLCDIYDGVVWKSFLTMNDEELLQNRYSLGLLVNVDWFQPYKHVSYSVGAIYISILNFPRQMRNRQENVIIAGIIPGPSEPKLHMNSYLEPLIKDLLDLQKGVMMKTTEGEHLVKALLLCSASDVPASRKIGGFLGHAAARGCSRCLKLFPTVSFGDKADYSGFEREEWPTRTVEDHRKMGMAWKHSSTLVNRHEIERKYGVRFTELLRLNYFDTVRYIIVDPMHNMLLGTAKLMITLWKNCGLLVEKDFDSIQNLVDKFVTPSDVGRIPHKIGSQFSGFTADQWKNWTLIYSSIALKPILPSHHYQCWCLFVDACRLMCSRAISLDNVAEMDSLLLSFCTMFERIYGASACTPNLHLHCHLKQCFEDFGPAGSFWAFPFERYNGILGSVPTNHQAIETQLMRKFSASQQTMQAFKGEDKQVQELFKGYLFNSMGSLKHEELPEMPLLSQLSESNIDSHIKTCRLIPPIKEGCLSVDEHGQIETTLKAVFGDVYIRTMLIYKYSKALYFGGDLYGSSNSIHSSSAVFYGMFGNAAPGISRRFLKVQALLKENGEEKRVHCYLSAVNWLEEHPNKHWFCSPIEIWRKFLPSSFPDDFIPVSHIKCRCAFVENTVQFNRILKETVTIIVPISNFYGL